MQKIHESLLWQCTVILVLTHTFTRRQHRKKYIIIVILTVVMIRRISDFVIINWVHITRYGNFLKPTIIQSNIQVFHIIILSSV